MSVATIDDLEAAGRALHELSVSVGVSTEAAARAVSDAMSKVEFDPAEAAALIQMNPNLSAFQKWRLKRHIMKLASA